MSEQLIAATPRAPASRLSGAVILVMAVAAGGTAANVWYNQPMLGAMASSLGVSEHAISAVPTATQIGFALGILLLVPLGDRFERRRLILWQLAASTVALAAQAMASNLGALIATSVFVGMGGSIAQQVIPFAAELAEPERRGRVVGTVMSGLLSGVLLARVLSGTVAQYADWRVMCWLAAAISVVLAAVLGVMLPRSVPSTRSSYLTLAASLVTLTRRYGALRRATLTQACVFATISAFWSVLALLLQGPPFGLGAATAGLFGVIGVAGILAAPLAGRTADRSGPRRVITRAIALVAASFVLFAAWPTLPGLVIGVVLVDLGAQAAMVANQSIIYGLAPDARGRVNTVFMTGMFLGGAIGSAGAGTAWAIGGGGIEGWRMVCAFCFLLALLAGVVHHVGRGAPRLTRDRADAR
ncbi:MAG TPA: MFS transporter [Acetobacteraceae bacterium]|nr:MFS transporter [Acetobacteraceae bacterium]